MQLFKGSIKSLIHRRRSANKHSANLALEWFELLLDEILVPTGLFLLRVTQSHLEVEVFQPKLFAKFCVVTTKLKSDCLILARCSEVECEFEVWTK